MLHSASKLGNALHTFAENHRYFCGAEIYWFSTRELVLWWTAPFCLQAGAVQSSEIGLNESKQEIEPGCGGNRRGVDQNGMWGADCVRGGPRAHAGDGPHDHPWVVARSRGGAAQGSANAREKGAGARNGGPVHRGDPGCRPPSIPANILAGWVPPPPSLPSPLTCSCHVSSHPHAQLAPRLWFKFCCDEFFMRAPTGFCVVNWVGKNMSALKGSPHLQNSLVEKKVISVF